MTALVSYFLKKDDFLPPIQGQLFEYVLASNGVFVRAQRPGFEASIPVTRMDPMDDIRGLKPHGLDVALTHKVPVKILKDMLEIASTQNYGEENGFVVSNALEVLFYLYLNENGWDMMMPEQEQTSFSCKPKGVYQPPLLELHSHHGMKARFSETDNADENGLRIYSVIGDLYKHPTILTRVSIYGHMCVIPSNYVYEMPEHLLDASYSSPMHHHYELERSEVRDCLEELYGNDDVCHPTDL